MPSGKHLRSREWFDKLYPEKTGQLGEGAVMEFAIKYRGTSKTPPRHNH